MKKNILKVLIMVFIATAFCFTVTKSMDYYWVNFSDSVSDIRILHNQHRLKVGAEPFSFSYELDIYSNKHAERMLAWRKMYHSNTNFNGKYRGENVGYSSIDDPVLVFNKWINSRGHRSNIEFMTYKRIGVGKAGDEKRGYYYCVVFSD